MRGLLLFLEYFRVLHFEGRIHEEDRQLISARDLKHKCSESISAAVVPLLVCWYSLVAYVAGRIQDA